MLLPFVTLLAGALCIGSVCLGWYCAVFHARTRHTTYTHNTSKYHGILQITVNITNVLLHVLQGSMRASRRLLLAPSLARA
jgi:hypothetical protein